MMSQVKTCRKMKRATSAQIRMLVDYMSKNTQFARGETGPPGSCHTVDEWLKLKQTLKEYGADKSLEQWKTTWRDLKRRAREENARAARESIASGNDDEVFMLSDLSIKILSVIGVECSTSTGAKKAPTGDQNSFQMNNQESQHEDDTEDDTKTIHEYNTLTREVTPT